MRSVLKKGVDISEFNGDVDFSSLRDSGVEFVILRCGYGSDYLNQDDEWFEQNVQKCLEANMPWGTYLYAYAQNAAMAKDEAAHTLRLLAGKPAPEYGVWYDVEDDTLPYGEALPELCKAYCAEIAKAGYQSGVYTFLSWLNQEDRLGCYSGDEELKQYGLWYAQFNDEINFAHPDLIDIWQYSDSTEIGGKIFDANYAYVEFPKKGSPAVPQKPEAPALKTVKVFRYFEDIPSWGKEAVKYYMDGGLLMGVGKDRDGKTILDLSEDLVRLYVTMKRKDDAAAAGKPEDLPQEDNE